MFGIVSDDEFTEQVERLNPTNHRKDAEIKEIKRGRTPGSTATPKEIRERIAELSIAGKPAKEIADEFNVSPSSISAYKNGATSTATYHTPDESLSKSNDAVRDSIIVNSRQKLMLALESITPDKLNDSKARDAAGIAKDMSAVIRNMEPDRVSGNSLNQQFIFYAPKTKTEKDFEVIEVE